MISNTKCRFNISKRSIYKWVAIFNIPKDRFINNFDFKNFYVRRDKTKEIKLFDNKKRRYIEISSENRMNT